MTRMALGFLLGFMVGARYVWGAYSTPPGLFYGRKEHDSQVQWLHDEL